VVITGLRAALPPTRTVVGRRKKGRRAKLWPGARGGEREARRIPGLVDRRTDAPHRRSLRQV